MKLTLKEKLLKIARTAGSLREAYKHNKKSFEYDHCQGIVDQIGEILKDIG